MLASGLKDISWRGDEVVGGKKGVSTTKTGSTGGETGLDHVTSVQADLMALRVMLSSLMRSRDGGSSRPSRLSRPERADHCFSLSLRLMKDGNLAVESR